VAIKLSNRDLQITPEHIGHTVAFVEVFDPPPNDGLGVVCVVCRTCGKSAGDVMLLSVVESAATVAEIRNRVGPLERVYIETPEVN